MKKNKTLKMSILALLIGIEIVLFLTPLGFIPVGVIRATTMHIPVIIAGIVLGVKGGAITGLVFGICSVITNTITPTPTSFVFSPFVTIGEISGNFNSLLIAIVPRVLIGIVAALVYKELKKRNINDYISITSASLLGAITSTTLVMGGIYLLFGPQYAEAKDMTYNALIGFIMGVVTTNGVIEAIVGAIIVVAIVKAIQPILNKVR